MTLSSVSVPVTLTNYVRQRIINPYLSDNTYIATPWLIHLILACRLKIRHIIKVTFSSNQAATQHIVVILDHDRYLCDCCMGVNLGIPCRHYFAVLRAMGGVNMTFSLSLIRRRYVPYSIRFRVPDSLENGRRIQISILKPFHLSLSTMSSMINAFPSLVTSSTTRFPTTRHRLRLRKHSRHKRFIITSTSP